MVRNFDLTVDRQPGLTRMLVSGFMNYDEALQYARQLYASPEMAQRLSACRSLIISDHNLNLIGTRYSYRDYEEFYQQTFAPLQISNEELLLIPDIIIQNEEDDDAAPTEREEAPTKNNSNTGDFDEDFW